MKSIWKQQTAKIFLAIKLTVLFSLLLYGFGYNLYLVQKQKAEELNKEFAVKKEKALGEFVMKLMNQVDVKQSVTKKQMIARTYVRVANEVFGSERQKYQYALVIALESRYDNSARSPQGAVGIAQVIPKYVKEFASRCGISDITEADLTNIEISILVGACQFRALMNHKDIEGNIALALYAYNAGMRSRAFQDLVGMKNTTNLETANYVAKFTYLSNVMKVEEKVKEISNESKETSKTP